jgi:hypothetical protein
MKMPKKPAVKKEKSQIFTEVAVIPCVTIPPPPTVALLNGRWDGAEIVSAVCGQLANFFARLENEGFSVRQVFPLPVAIRGAAGQGAGMVFAAYVTRSREVSPEELKALQEGQVGAVHSAGKEDK